MILGDVVSEVVAVENSGDEVLVRCIKITNGVIMAHATIMHTNKARRPMARRFDALE